MRWSRDARNALLITLAVAIAFGDVLLFGRGFFRDDVYGYHFPMKKVVRDVGFADGFPYWNPSYHAGQPLAANPAYQLFYPPQWLLYLPGFVWWFQFHILLHIAIAAIGTYFLLRSMDLSSVAASFGAVSYALGGPLLSLTTRLPFLFAWAWVPLIFLFVRRLLLRPNRRDFVWTAVLVGLQAILGEPTSFLQTAGLALAYAIYRVVGARNAPLPRRGFVLMAAAFACGLLVAAVQLGPALDHARDSIRAEGFSWQVASNWSTPWIRTLELVFPEVFRVLVDSAGEPQLGSLYAFRIVPFISDIYSGLLVIVLAVAGMLVGVRHRVLVLILLAGSLVLAVGAHAPAFGFLHQLGIFSSIRYPEKFLLSGLFVLVVWASRVLDQLLKGDRGLRRTAMALTILWILVALMMAGAMGWSRYWGLTIARGVAVLVIFATLSKNRRIAVAGLLAFPLMDLSFLHFGIASRVSRRFFEEPAIAQTLPMDRSAYRIFHKAAWDDWEGTTPALESTLDRESLSREGMFPFRGAAFGFRGALEQDVDQTALMTSTRFLRAAEAEKRLAGSWPPFFLTAANVTLVAEFQPIGSNPVVFVSRDQPAPRYFLARRLMRGVPGIHAQARDAFIEFEPFLPASGTIDRVVERPSTIRIELKAQGRTFLVAANTHHKYWRATIDGKPAALLPANLAFHGVVVPPGGHVVELRYRNPLILPFGLVSLVTLVALVGGRLWSAAPWRRFGSRV